MRNVIAHYSTQSDAEAIAEAEGRRDLRDLRTARRANKGKKPISLSEMKKKLGL